MCVSKASREYRRPVGDQKLHTWYELAGLVGSCPAGQLRSWAAPQLGSCSIPAAAGRRPLCVSLHLNQRDFYFFGCRHWAIAGRAAQPKGSNKTLPWIHHSLRAFERNLLFRADRLHSKQLFFALKYNTYLLWITGKILREIPKKMRFWFLEQFL